MDNKPKRTPTGDYPVGFAAPPEKYRYPKGKSGNLKGRPKATEWLQSEKVDGMLNASVPVEKNGRIIKMSKREIELRKLIQLALQDKDLKACDRLLKKFKKYGLLPDVPIQQSGGVIQLPRDKKIPHDMAKLLITTFGAAPWSAEEIEAIRPAYENARAEYWADKKEALRSIYLGMKRGSNDR